MIENFILLGEYFLIFLIVVIVHELGHYVGFRLFGHKPKIRFTWFGIVIGENCVMKLTPIQLYAVSFFGIIAGVPIVMFDNILLLAYLISCSIDITNMIFVIGMKAKHMKKPLYESNLDTAIEEYQKHSKHYVTKNYIKI